MCDRDGYVFQQAERDEALLTIGNPVVFEREGRACEDPRRVNEVQAVVPDIGNALVFVPLEPHLQSVYTRGQDGKSASLPANARVERRAVGITYSKALYLSGSPTHPHRMHRRVSAA
jgi:hypothetical protein